MKYAFVDYENLNSLDGLELTQYEKIYLFVGANQTAIHLSEKFNQGLNIHLVTVNNIGKNNLDFHIAYFLGKLDCEVDKSIQFCVLSKDLGYQGICHFIQHQPNARQCELITPNFSEEPVNLIALPSPETQQPEKQNAENDYLEFLTKYKNNLIKTNKRSLPTKLKALTNHIYSTTALVRQPKNTKQKILNQIINHLQQKGIIKINDKKVSFDLKKL